MLSVASMRMSTALLCNHFSRGDPAGLKGAHVNTHSALPSTREYRQPRLRTLDSAFDHPSVA